MAAGQQPRGAAGELRVPPGQPGEPPESPSPPHGQVWLHRLSKLAELPTQHRTHAQMNLHLNWSVKESLTFLVPLT